MIIPKLIVAIGILAASAQADIVYQLDNPVQSGSPGQILGFYGTVTNTGPDSYTDGFGHTDTGLWPNAFELIFPVFPDADFGPGDSYTGVLFDILISPAAAGLSIDATSYLYGWPDGADRSDFSQAHFSNPQDIVVTATPEPILPLVLLAALVLVACARKRIRYKAL